MHLLHAEDREGPRRGQGRAAGLARRRAQGVRRPVQQEVTGAPLRFLLAAAAGILFGLAFPDYSQAWLIFVWVLPLVVAVVRARGPREAFCLGWLFQTIAWLIMVPWVIRVMSHYGGLPLPLGILLYIAMALYLGMYGGLFALFV